MEVRLTDLTLNLHDIEVKMKCLTVPQANTYLQSIDMKLDDWNKITDISGEQDQKDNWINFRPQKEHLLDFSQHVAGWLPKGNWKLFQIDNSTGWMDPVQLSLFGGLIWGADGVPSSLEDKTFLFEFGNDSVADENAELLIANLICVFFSLSFTAMSFRPRVVEVNCLACKMASFIFSQETLGTS